jgi:hypothetical protein
MESLLDYRRRPTTMAHSDKPVRLMLSPQAHQQFREYAAAMGKPMAIVAKGIVQRFMSSRQVVRPAEEPPKSRRVK